MPAGGPPPPRPPLALVFSITITGILANTLINAPLPDILREFSLEGVHAGVLVAVATLPGIAMAPVIGLAADRFGRRHVLVPCLAIFGIFGVLAAFAPSYPLLLLARFLQGVGSAGLINLAVVIIADHWSGPERARLIGYNAAVLTVSVALFPALGGLLTELGGWRLSFAPYAVAIVTALAVLRWLPRRPPSLPQPLRDQVRAAAVVLRNPVVSGSIGFGFVLFVLIFGLFLTAMPILLDHTYGLRPGLRGLVLSVPATSATIAALALGRMRARFGASRLLLAANGVFALGFAAIGLAPALGFVLAGALLYGFGEGTSIPTVQDLVAGRAPDESRAAVVAVWVGAARFGQTVGPLLAGVTLASVGPETTFVLGGAVGVALLLAQVASRRLVDFDRQPSPIGGRRP